MSLSFLTAEQAVAEMPACLVPSYDPMYHTTLAHLRGMADFELDLHEQQHEDSLIKTWKDLRAVKRWFHKLS